MGGASIDRPWRVAFVGGAGAADACPKLGAAPALVTRFLAIGRDPLGELRGLAPDVVVVFDPSADVPALPDDIGAATVAYLTRPAETADLGRYDRLLVSERGRARTLAPEQHVWRAVPLPVADQLFHDVADPDPAAPPLVTGGSRWHRSRVLRTVGAALTDAELAAGDKRHSPARGGDAAWIAVSLHDPDGGGFEHRVAMDLARGRLVLSEPLHPRHGLEPGIDYAEFRSGAELGRLVASARNDPRPWRWMRVRGRRKAEQFRASRVWPRLVADVLADVAAFGRASRG